MESSMSSARPHFSSNAPIKVKKGMASNSSLDKMPNTLSGKLPKKLAGNQPMSMAYKPENSPNAAKENATGKPISITKISPRNIRGANCSTVIAGASRKPSSFHIGH